MRFPCLNSVRSLAYLLDDILSVQVLALVSAGLDCGLDLGLDFLSQAGHELDVDIRFEQSRCYLLQQSIQRLDTRKPTQYQDSVQG